MPQKFILLKKGDYGMNKIILIGRLTKDIEVKTSQSGTELARFSLAVTRPFKNKQSDKYETDFFDCVVWRQAASLLAKYCHKGDQLAIEGWMSINDYVDKSTGEKRRTYEVNVEKFDFGAKSSGKPNTATSSASAPQGGIDTDPFDEEMPF
jgi:single stranded DNA-binding protein